MVMGSLASPEAGRLRIGCRVRMILDEAHLEEQPTSHRHRFEPLQAPSIAQVNRLEIASV